MKRKNTAYTVIAIAFILFNIIVFVIPSNKTGTFWIAYGFSVVAFAVQVYLWRISIGGNDDLRSKFFKIPIVKVGITYIIVQLTAFVIFMLLPDIPIFITIVVCSAILCISAIGFVITEAAIDEGMSEVARIDQKVSVKRQYIKELQIEAEMLAESETDAALKEKLTALAKKIRLSDPMSDDSLVELEKRLLDKVLEIKTSNDKDNDISEAEILLLERNKKCKMMKG